MLVWREFAAARPDLADAGRDMFYQHGLGLGFLATTRPDGGPRVHPMCPLLTQDGLYAFIVPGPKLRDLRRDGRYALHCETFAPPRHDDAFYLTGKVREHDDRALWSTLTEQFLRERNMDAPWEGFDRQTLVEFLIDRCLLTVTAKGHTIWRAK